MSTTNPNSNADLNRLAELLPQFGFRLVGDNLQATAGTTPCCQVHAAGHLYVYPNTAFGMKCQRCATFTHLSRLLPADALGAVAGLYGNADDAKPSPASLEQHQLHEKVLAVCQRTLAENTTVAGSARQYVTSRGISPEYATAQGYGLVPAPEVLVRLFGDDFAAVQAAGYMDNKMVGRVVMPYRDADGMIAGYCARSLVPGDTEDAPKYLYSPGLRKGSPYLLDKVDRLHPVVAVEGILSADVLRSQGLANVIGIGGSKLSKAQVASLKRAGVSVVILSMDYDPESRAGDKGAEESAVLLKNEGLRAYVVMPDVLRDPEAPDRKEDPDSYVLKYGMPAYLQLLSQAVDPLYHRVYRAISGVDPRQAAGIDDGITAAARLLCEHGADKITRTDLVGMLSHWSGHSVAAVDERLVAAENAEGLKLVQQQVVEQIEKARSAAASGELPKARDYLTRSLAKAEAGVVEQVEFFDDLKFLLRVGQVPTEVFLTGWEEVDKMVRILPGELVIIAARPRHGKSSAAYNVAINALMRNDGKTIVLFSHELPEHLAMARIATTMAHRLHGKQLRSKEDVIAHYKPMADGSHGFPECIKAVFNQLGDWGRQKRFVFVNQPSWNAAQIQAYVEQVRDQGCNIGGVIIDYVEMIPPVDGTATREQQVGQTAHALRLMANQMLIPVMLLSQINRDRSRPTLESLRYSGQLEQEASTVIGLYRETADNNQMDEPPETDEMEVIVLKNRSGTQGNRKLQFHMKTGLMVAKSPGLDVFGAAA